MLLTDILSGCQAEVGGNSICFLSKAHVEHVMTVACSMAAAGYTACMGGNEKLFYTAFVADQSHQNRLTTDHLTSGRDCHRA